MAWWDDEPCGDTAGDDPYCVHVLERRLPPTLDFDTPEVDE